MLPYKMAPADSILTPSPGFLFKESLPALSFVFPFSKEDKTEAKKKPTNKETKPNQAHGSKSFLHMRVSYEV